MKKGYFLQKKISLISHKNNTMKTLFQTLGKNVQFSTRGNGNYGFVIRTGWKVSRLGEAKKLAIIEALDDSNVDQVYRRENKIYALLFNGTEKRLF